MNRITPLHKFLRLNSVLSNGIELLDKLAMKKKHKNRKDAMP